MYLNSQWNKFIQKKEGENYAAEEKDHGCITHPYYLIVLGHTILC